MKKFEFRNPNKSDKLFTGAMIVIASLSLIFSIAVVIAIIRILFWIPTLF